MKIEITSRWTGMVLFACETDSWRVALEAGIKAGANLTDANLTDANLRGANLTDANLTDANLRGANLTDANLTGANLRGANLRGANLTDANLRGANLTDANLTGANLRGANLRGANLTGANLRGANLRGANLTDANLTDANLTDANLTPIRDDLWAVLSAAPAEAAALLAAIREGRIDGSVYEGTCACLVGTIANARHCGYQAIEGLRPNANRSAERFFLGIRPGDTPETHPGAKIVAEWIADWIARMQATFGPVMASE